MKKVIIILLISFLVYSTFAARLGSKLETESQLEVDHKKHSKCDWDWGKLHVKYFKD